MLLWIIAATWTHHAMNNIEQVVRITAVVSLVLFVIALGMHCTLKQALSVFRQPRLLSRSIFAMNIVMPVVAAVIAAATGLPKAVKVVLIALAVSPIPPFLPKKELKLVTHPAHVYGLLVVASVLAVVLVPLSLFVLGRLFDQDVQFDPIVIARTVLISVLLPLAAGMFIRFLWPGFAEAVRSGVGGVATVALIVVLALVLISRWDAIGAMIGNGTLLACVLFAVIGLAVGHFAGGPDEDDRTVLALATASRHPGVAIAVGTAILTDQKPVTIVVLLYLLSSTVASIPYTMWRKRRHEKMLGSHV